MYVLVSGPGVAATPADLEAAESIGALLGAEGHIVVTGGLGGVMAAASKGAHRVGGMTVGLLPGSDRAAANPYVAVALPTGLGEMRNPLLVRVVDAVIAVGGSWGTLSEVALAMRTGVPVVVVGGWPLSEPGVRVAGSPEDAVAAATSA